MPTGSVEEVIGGWLASAGKAGVLDQRLLADVMTVENKVNAYRRVRG